MLENGTKVRVSYVGMLEDGTVFDDSQRHGGPLEFVIGNNEVIPGFEEAVREMSPGEEREVIVPPEKAYGERRRDLVVEIPTEQMVATGKNPYPGMVLRTPSGLYGVVTAVSQTTTVDFNHPLAGRHLKFRIKLEEVVGKEPEMPKEDGNENPGAGIGQASTPSESNNQPSNEETNAEGSE